MTEKRWLTTAEFNAYSKTCVDRGEKPPIGRARILGGMGELIEIVTQETIEDTDAPICTCGRHQIRNTDPLAGVPSMVNEVGAVWECIPCLVRTRRIAIEIHQKAEKELYELQRKLVDARAEIARHHKDFRAIRNIVG